MSSWYVFTDFINFISLCLPKGRNNCNNSDHISEMGVQEKKKLLIFVHLLGCYDFYIYRKPPSSFFPPDIKQDK